MLSKPASAPMHQCRYAKVFYGREYDVEPGIWIVTLAGLHTVFVNGLKWVFLTLVRVWWFHS